MGNPWAIRYTALACSALLIADILVTSPVQIHVPLWIVLLNTAIILAVIWITAILSIRLEKAQRLLKKQENELQKANQELQQVARHDSLTGVSNRRLFDAELEAECERANRGGIPLSLLMIDVDHFKLFNDIMGHQPGDECLTRIAQTIQSTLRRPGDMIARYGGEEFAVILPVTNLEGAIDLAEDIRKAVMQLAIHNPAPQVNGPITISVGVACISSGMRQVESKMLISAADAALYRAKYDGRNCVRVAEMAVSPLEVAAGRS